MSDDSSDLGYSLAVKTCRWEDTPALQPGQVLKDRYLLIKEIGVGGQSKVYKARDLVAYRAGLDNVDVALKLIWDNTDVQKDFVSLVHREARRLRDLAHPNIVRVYDMDQTGALHFMVMELLSGNPLSKVLKQKDQRQLEMQHVQRIVHDVGSALAYSHSKGIVHSDLKPGNIFINDDGSITLIDFNISAPIAPHMREKEESTLKILVRLGAVTPAYASPQQLQGADTCEADDVFSFALLIYLCLAGHRPFGPKNALEAMEAGVRPKRIEHVSSAQWKVLSQALAFEDEERTASIAEFVAGFQLASKQTTTGWLRSHLSWT
ncbi:serine/threonine protein kinase [Roseibium denhamense]|uniref:Serine/threonine protein kinase n=1 Tax=Roseibium denhamense TaxID=76305 RepID=A0ABY1NXQ2_9HYPH|nr:serine/threonine-protein kinase [Roseibium denhamense]MTI04858.1 serine/threonine protein kinase [Roseibium denhamense]SMP19974.1 Serine/threonine protein kinase [Roseibium denhamense]